MGPSPGWKTSEFWVTLAILALSAFLAVPPDARWQVKVVALAGAVASALGYKISRTLVKRAALAAGATDVQAEAAVGDDAPRGFVRLWLLALLAAAALLLALPARAQEAPAGAFGGCSARGNFCAGPAASVSLVSYGFRTRQFTAGLMPGIGYEAYAWADKWYSLGAELRAAVQTGGQTSALFTIAGSFAHYLRLGVGYQVIGGSGEWIAVGGFGFNFGAPPGAGAAQATAAALRSAP